jgi:hypothetical protein
MSAYDDAWADIASKGNSELRVVLTVRTDVVMASSLSVRASLVRPSLAKDDIVNFTLAQVSSRNEKLVWLSNPADVPVAVHLLSSILDERECLARSSDVSDNHVVNDSFHIGQHARTWAVIPPHEEMALGPVLFQPSAVASYHGRVLVRNNLTYMQAVEMFGEVSTSVAVLIQ